MSHSNRPSHVPPQNPPASVSPQGPEAAPLALPAQITTIANAPTTVGGTTILVVPPIVIMPQNPAYPPPSSPHQAPPPPHEPQGRASYEGCSWEKRSCSRHFGHPCHRRRRFFRFLFFLAFVGFGIFMAFRFLSPWSVAFRGVHLDTEQRYQLRQIYASSRQGWQEDRREIRKLQNQMLLLLQKENVNKQEVEAMIEAWFAKRKQILLRRSEAITKAHATLTPEQRARLAFNLKRLRARHDRWRGRFQRLSSFSVVP